MFSFETVFLPLNEPYNWVLFSILLL